MSPTPFRFLIRSIEHNLCQKYSFWKKKMNGILSKIGKTEILVIIVAVFLLGRYLRKNVSLQDISWHSSHSSDSAASSVQVKQEVDDIPLEKPAPLLKATVHTETNDAEGCAKGTDCYKLQYLLKYNWPADRPKSLVYILTYRLDLLRNFFVRFDKFFNDQFQYPVVIFHEADFAVYKDEIRAFTNSPIYFHEVKFNVPAFVKKVPEMKKCNNTVGYRHMCRFHAKFVYDLPIMQNIKYYLRLDDDSEVLCPIEYDLFKYMESNNYMYGYFCRKNDTITCTKELWETTYDYVSKFHISPSYLDDWPHRSIYLNNFEITEIDFWKSKEYQLFVDYLDKQGGFYSHRWGDAPVHALGLALFAERNRIHYFKDIGYRHKRIFSDNKCGEDRRFELERELGGEVPA